MQRNGARVHEVSEILELDEGLDERLLELRADEWIASAGAASGSSKIFRTERENSSGGCVVFIRVSAVSCLRCRTNAKNWYAAKTKPPTTVTVEINARPICSSTGMTPLPQPVE